MSQNKPAFHDGAVSAMGKTERKPEPIPAQVHNRGLFATHFLAKEKGLQDMPEWRDDDGVDEAKAKIRKLIEERAINLSSATNEPQTEHDLIQPILDVLWGTGSYEVQPRLPAVDEERQPDYAFFLSPQACQEAKPALGTMEYWGTVSCLGDAKRWGLSLDRARGPGGTPSAQICNYLYRSGARWGILTNGRIWRLYERERSSPGGIYYEVDLLDLRLDEGREVFKWFYMFFRREAFVPDESGETFLDKVLRGSVEHATGVGDKLREAVYDALRYLINGFLEYKRNKLPADDPATLAQVHEAALIVLYRLLFILYAEDRELFPLKDLGGGDSHYSPFSLKTTHKRLNTDLKGTRRFADNIADIWRGLLTLFQVIDEGPEAGGETILPAYNGGLFSPDRYPRIAHTPVDGTAQWLIGDRRIAEVIDLLAYERKSWDKPGTDDIDYTALDVQHLGTIYEGLLELKPVVAAEPMVEVAGKKGRPTFRPQREVPEPKPIKGQTPRTVKAGEVYLLTDKGERKATGSYYTPKFIVDYIVEHTVGPLADEAKARGAEIRREMGNEDPDALTEEQRQRLLEPYLSVRVLDPAMGSAHFLVGAADLLSRAMATDPNLAPPREAGDDDPQGYYKRRIVERCLYGVDLNPLAVELAKLSLWLHTVSESRALSFLDHHLRCGNSLIGARVSEDLTREPPRFSSSGKRLQAAGEEPVLAFTEALSAKHLQSLLNVFRQIVEAPSGDAEIERSKAAWYSEMDAARDRFRAVANCWLAPFFGVEVLPEQYERAVAALRANEDTWLALEAEEWFDKAQGVAREHRFFHWELEFPEAFFTPRGLKPPGERGFDAVIGNPPYRGLPPGGTRVLAKDRYASAGSTMDSFAVFMERAAELTANGRLHGMIVPSGWLTAQEHRQLRAVLLESETPLALVHLPHDVFPDAYIDCVIWTARRGASDAAMCSVLRMGAKEAVQSVAASSSCWRTVRVSRWQSSDGLAFVTEPASGAWLDRWRAEEWCVCAGSVLRVARGTTPFEEWRAGDERGHMVGYSGSVSRFELECGELTEVVHDPSLAEYRDAGWFAGPRLLVRRIISRQGRVHAALAELAFVVSKSYLVAQPGDTEYSLCFVLGVLNSALLSKALVARSEIAKRDDFPQLDIATVNALPIPRISFTTPPEERAEAVETAKRLYEEWVAQTPPWSPPQAGGKGRTADNGLQPIALRHNGLKPIVYEFVASELKAGRSDVVHDLLAFLAERMTDMHREKN